MATAITFNSFSLQDANFITEDIQDSGHPKRRLGIYNRLRRHGGIITDDTYGVKTIGVNGIIKGTSVSNLEGLIDNFMAAMAVKEKNLDIAYNSGTRRYTATPTSHPVVRVIRGTNWAKFDIQFSATEFGEATASVEIENSLNQTTSPNNLAMTFGGSAPEQFPLITITLDSFTGAAINTITLTNNDTSQAISVSRAWTATEVLVIDTRNQTVKVDGVEVDFSGAFLVFEPGARTLVYSDDFTARQVDIVVDQTYRYL